MSAIGGTGASLSILDHIAFRAQTRLGLLANMAFQYGVPKSHSTRPYSRLSFSPCSANLAHYVRCSRILKSLVEPAYPGHRCPQIITGDRRPSQVCRVSIRYFRVLDSLRPGMGSRWGRPTAESLGEAKTKQKKGDFPSTHADPRSLEH